MRIPLTLILVLAPAAAHAQSNEAQAEVLFKQGKEAMKAKTFAQACTDFEASQKLAPAVSTEMNLADCREQNGQIATAYGLWIDVERITRDDPKQKSLMKTAKDRAAKLEPDLSYLIINVPDDSKVDGLEISLNGQPVDQLTWNTSLPEDGGDYTVEGKAPAHEPWSTKIHLAGKSDKQSVDVPKFKTLPPPDITTQKEPPPPDDTHASPPPVQVVDSPHGMSGKRKAALGLGVVGVLGIAGGVVFELSAEKAYTDAKNEPDNARQTDDTNRANLDRGIAVGAGVVGVAAAGAAIYLWVSGGTHEHATTALVPTFGHGTTGLAWCARF